MRPPTARIEQKRARIFGLPRRIKCVECRHEKTRNP